MVGLALEIPVNISNTSGHSSPAALAADRNYVHVVWADNTSGNSEILIQQKVLMAGLALEVL